MSFPGLYYDVKRRQNAVASGFTDRGDPVQLVGSATLARCIARLPAPPGRPRAVTPVMAWMHSHAARAA